MTIFVLQDANVLDPRHGQYLEGVDIVVVDGRIAEMGKGVRIPAGAQACYRLGGLTVMPGLIDCHVHVLASHMNLGLVARMHSTLSIISALPILQGMIERGFTTVRDAGGADWALAQASEKGMITAPRIFPSGKALSQTGGHGDFRPRSDRDLMEMPCACAWRAGAIGRVVDGVDAVRIAAREELTMGASQIKVMASGGVASPIDPIGNMGYSVAELQAIVEEAAGWQTYVMAHAYTPQAISRAIKVGIRTIEHGNLIDEATARQAKDAGTYLVPTVVTYEALANEGPELGLPADSLAKVETVRTAGKDAIAMLHRVGVKMGYGSDLLGPSQRHQASELRIRAEIIGNLAALQSATTVAAEILNRDDLGVVKPGALADLLIVRGDPLQDIGLLADQSEHVSEHLLAVMKDGLFITNTLQSC